ncbi:hypothetical protein DESPIG_02982 [Desulfovibrio piger ATCC 29098]|uniref:Uncharacterized protein n=1 Tax=Desulfovibrio piger ATCC 29098 TaxID=411464 RepID=B6WY02_9BACT|nr:hypothetical protein DESPIG_02982 [Desulfovibrio piger ATCC 29098]
MKAFCGPRPGGPGALAALRGPKFLSLRMHPFSGRASLKQESCQPPVFPKKHRPRAAGTEAPAAAPAAEKKHFPLLTPPSAMLITTPY